MSKRKRTAPARPPVIADPAKLQEAMTCHQQGRLAEAEVLYREILARTPSYFDALHWLGMLQVQKGSAAAGADLLRRAIALNPGYAASHAGLGTALRLLDRPQEAVASYDRALALRPDYPEALANRGVTLRDVGRHEEALASLDRALDFRPAFPEALHSRGNALFALKRLADALASYDRALELRPDFPEALCNRANVLHDLERLPEALESIDRALSLKRGFPDALFNRGNVLLKMERPQEALASYDGALALRPDFADALSNRGNALRDLNRLDEALASQDRALALAPALATAHFNRGATLRDLGRLDEALVGYDTALAIKPDYREAFDGRGNALMDLRQHGEALDCFARAIELSPDYVSARFNAGICSLLIGDFESGWDGYEWRWREDRPGRIRTSFTQPRWQGTPLDGVLLAWGEQGLGDQILYLEFVSRIEPLATRVIVALDARLTPLARRSFPRVAVIDLDETVEQTQCDAQAPLGSIAQYFLRGWDDFSRRTSAYLLADTERAARLRARLADELHAQEKVICGLSWISANARSGAQKSMTLRELQPVLGLPGARFVDLQYGDTRDERAALPDALRSRLVHLDEIDNRNDIDGLAALIEACDVVVTVSNTTAHLAGALGKPVLLMLPYSRGRMWYWHEDRDDSPWYPSVRLIRQPTPGDWTSAIESVKRALEAMARGS